MRKIKLYTVVSSDGYATDLNGSMEWLYEIEGPPQVDWGLDGFFRETDLVVMSRSHYSMLWTCDAVHRYLEKKCIIVKKRHENNIPKKYDAQHIVIKGNDYSPVVEYISGLKNEQGGDIWLVGDHKLIRAFLEKNMIDEITLTMLPVRLGNGIKLFPASFCQDDWMSVKIKGYPNGAVQIKYGTSAPLTTD